LVIISGIFWLSGVDGSELLVCGEALLETGKELDERKGNLRAAPTNPRAEFEKFSRERINFRKVFPSKNAAVGFREFRESERAYYSCCRLDEYSNLRSVDSPSRLIKKNLSAPTISEVDDERRSSARETILYGLL
jgi:hypothetical protein